MSSDMLFPGTVILVDNKEQDNERPFLFFSSFLGRLP